MEIFGGPPGLNEAVQLQITDIATSQYLHVWTHMPHGGKAAEYRRVY